MMNKKRIAVMIFLLFTIGMIGCKKSTPQLNVLDWAIAGITGFENKESISEEKIVELNQLLAEKGKDYQIQFHVITFDEGELSEEDEETLKKCDLITMQNQIMFTDKVKFYQTLLEYTKNNWFEPLDEYLNTEDGKKIKEKMLSDLTLQSGYWDEKQWVLPTRLPYMQGTSLRIKRELYEKSGWDKDAVPDFIRCDELFEKLYVANGEKPFLVLSDRKTVRGICGIKGELPHYLAHLLTVNGSIWDDNGLGAGSLKTTGNDFDTRNLLKEPYFEEYLNAWRRYIERGYVNTNMNAKPSVEIWNSYVPVISEQHIDEEWIVPKAEDYVLTLFKQPAEVYPSIGIGAKSEQKQLAFEALTDMILDQDISDAIQNLDPYGLARFVFHTGLSEEGEKEYQKLVNDIPQFSVEHTFDTFTMPEIEEINKVYAEYSTDEGDDDTQKVLERHFSKDGKVTEESIHEGIQRLNEKLDAAGMEKFIEALKEEKLRIKR